MLAEILRRLLPIYEPERIYLFGSSARGVSRRGSDYDLMLVIPDDADEERARARRAYEVLWGLGVAVDVVIWRRGAFDARATAPTSLPATVMREGILLHAA
jgi:predicted nucleotidyltransferase